MDKIKQIIEKYYHPTAGEMVRFGLIGVINTTLDILVYYFLTRQLEIFRGSIVTPKSLSFLVASAFSFLANRWWTFHRRDKIKLSEVFKFYSTVGTGIFINVGAVYVLSVWCQIYDLTAILISAGLTFLWGFTFSKWWVFKSPE